jgi:EpsI family protein
MKGVNLRMLSMALVMIVGAGLAWVLTPTIRMADEGPKVNLESMIPQQFGDWRIDPTLVPITVSPDVQAKLDQLYAQTLSRTYVNGGGQRIMLSIAYGSDQAGEATQLHRPEFCYVAQGFQVTANIVGQLITEHGAFMVRRLLAIQGNRHEPITYWITVGDKATLPGVSRKLAQLGYGLSGKVPDGMLVRVSSIQNNDSEAYQLQDKFIQQLLGAIADSDRVRIIGRLST